MQIGGKGMEKKIVNMVLEKKALKVHKFKKTPFHASLFKEWSKHIPIWNYPNDDFRFMELRFVLPKPNPMNCLH